MQAVPREICNLLGMTLLFNRLMGKSLSQRHGYFCDFCGVLAESPAPWRVTTMKSLLFMPEGNTTVILASHELCVAKHGVEYENCSYLIQDSCSTEDRCVSKDWMLMPTNCPNDEFLLVCTWVFCSSKQSTRSRWVVLWNYTTTRCKGLLDHP